MDSLIIESGQKFTRIVINRPERANALDAGWIDSFQKFLVSKDSRRHPLVILTASYQEGKKRVFCSGGDLKAYASLRTKGEGVSINRRMTKALGQIAQHPSIFVAVVDGACIGGGCEVILACDYIMATNRARFQFGQAKVGLTPGWGGTKRLLERVRPSRALGWLATARSIACDEARDQGLVDELIAEDTTRSQSFLSDWFAHQGLLNEIKQVIRRPRQEASVFEKRWWSLSHRARLTAFMGGKS